jgi:glycosyltransferase involved in cell wall biosynthesis
MAARKVLMVGPYPPPEGGWSTLIREEREELESRGIECRVLNLGANRHVKSDRYISIRNSFDLLANMLRHGLSRYLFRLHMNGDSWKGMAIVICGSLIAMFCFRRASLSFHAGVNQPRFPHRGNPILGVLWFLVFNLVSVIICDNDEVRERIMRYRLSKREVYGISPFSSRRVAYTEARLSADVERFLAEHDPVLFAYYAYRPEYMLNMLFEALRQVRERYGSVGLIAVDDRSYPDPAVESEAAGLMTDEALSGAVLATGSVGRDEFLTLMSRSDLHVRTPVTDGVCSSVLESLYLKVPVVAAENGSRPNGVVTYDGLDQGDMVSILVRSIENIDELRRSLDSIEVEAEDSVIHLGDIIEERCLR